MASRGVAPDGSPVDVYLLLPSGLIPALIHAAIAPGASVLDLGCGVGRLARPLVRLGHAVTGVDQSQEMLRRADGFETIQADIEGLDLARRFDVVLLASHLVNTADHAKRKEFLLTCRRHVTPQGAVLIERYDPAWVRSARPSVRSVGDVEIELHDLTHDGDRLDAAVTYRVGRQRWTQPFRAVALDDDGLRREAGWTGLVLRRWLDDEREWALLQRSSASRDARACTGRWAGSRPCG